MVQREDSHARTTKNSTVKFPNDKIMIELSE